ncbi:MAG TPA: PTS transporter subunit EIIB [Candidatus Alistipes intestinipullorum]|nr:PTS transporter subunit EIIB [Candidatus Alistipes intestinipullorum]
MCVCPANNIESVYCCATRL